MTEQEIEALCLWIEDGGPECAPNELRNSALKDCLTAIRQLQQPWRGMETCPKDGTKFLAMCEISGETGCLSWEGEYFADHGFQYVTVQPEPTAWMPLPTPPETGQ